MAERVGKIGLNAGTPWSLFAENTAFEDTEGLGHPKGLNTEAARLHKEDMRLFGVCPAKDGLMLAVCKECQCILQVSSLITHYERKHAKVLSSLKRSPTRICSVTKDILSPSRTFGKSKLLKSPGDNSFIRIEEVDPTDINVKIEEVPLMIPNFNHAAKGKIPKINLKTVIGNKAKAAAEKPAANWKGQHKKPIVNQKDKEYDPDKHCGVWIEEQARSCTRSLTCKTHTLASRREVTGRSKMFDALLADYKLRLHSSKESGSSSGTNTPTATPSPTRSNPPSFTLKSERRLSSPTDSRSQSSKESSRSEAKKHSPSEDHTSPFTQTQPTYVDYICEDHSSSMQTISHHPKPLAVNSFSARRVGSGCYSFGRKFNSFRLAAQTMVDKLIKANLNTVNSQQLHYRGISGAGGICSTQVLDEGVSAMDSSASFPNNSPSNTEPSRFGPVPRVKTKPPNSPVNLKRQVSDSFLTEHFSSSRKRRHSADSLKNDIIGQDGNLTENSINDTVNLKDPTAVDLAKCVSEIGHALQGFDVESLDGNFLSGALLCTDSSQSGISNLTITGNNMTTNLNTNMGLNSSLSLCQTMGLNQGLSQNLGMNLAGSQNVVVDQSQVVNHMVAPNVAVTQGMMVSLPNVSQVQSLAAYQGNLKEILPAPGAVSQQTASPGVYITTQGQQVVSQLANGIVSSPETYSIAYSPGQSIATANINASIRAANSASSAGKRLAVSGPSRVSQLVVRQPSQQPSQQASQQLQSFHKDTNSQRSSPFQKPAPFDSRKAPSPIQSVQNTARSPSQQTNLATTATQLLSSTAQFSSTSQPIAQLKQMQMQQLQQQPMISPLNSAMQAESLSYQQQILPKLVVSPSRNLPAQIVSSQAMQQRSLLEPSTP